MRIMVHNLQARKMVCTKCNNVTQIFRKKNWLREVGHLKKLWCVKCAKRTRHEEKGEMI